MHLTASAAIIVLVCMASSIDASKLPMVTAIKSHRPMLTRPSSDTNININQNKNENDNFLFSLLFSELMADVNTQDPCDSDDDDSCFWNRIGADALRKSQKPAQQTEGKVVADDEADKPTFGKGFETAKSFRPRPIGSRNYNLNSNSNRNSNIDYSSLFASVEQYLRNKNKKLAKDTIVKNE